MTFIQSAPGGSVFIRYLWRRRRWVYGAYMLVAVLRIPARVGFRLVAPVCDTRLTLTNAGLSMTKVPHIALFAIFFVLTVLQFDRLNGRALRLSLLATVALGVLVELEEGASRTGNCRVTDVLPDITGALAATAAVLGVTMVRDWTRARTPGE
jgi:hypothetical protein